MKITIDKKITLFIVSIIFALASILGYYFLWEQKRMLGSELNERVSVLLDNLSFNLEYPVLVRDEEAIARLVGGVMAQRDIAFCCILGPDGKLIYRAGTEAMNDTREFQAPIAMKTAAGPEEGLILDLPGKTEERIGTVYLRVSLSGLAGKISHVRNTILAVVIVVIILSSLGAYLLIRRNIGTPVARLVEATRRISAGDLEHRVVIESGDEMGVLADSFNKMTESLLAAQEELLHREKLSMLGQIAEGMGNELRNPLGVISNAVFYLKTVTPDAVGAVREYLDIIDHEIDNSVQIISDLVDFAQIRAPRVEKVNVPGIMKGCLGKCAVPRNVRVIVGIPGDIPPVTVDPRQMGQVFRNIIINGIQAMPEGGDLTISAKSVQGSKLEVQSRGDTFNENGTSKDEQNMDFVEISIADCGEGITAENMKKLFQPLFTTKSRGIGLGLTVAKKLTEENGGQIRVESRPGEGATFTVALPVSNR